MGINDVVSYRSQAPEFESNQICIVADFVVFVQRVNVILYFDKTCLPAALHVCLLALDQVFFFDLECFP